MVGSNLVSDTLSLSLSLSACATCLQEKLLGYNKALYIYSYIDILSPSLPTLNRQVLRAIKKYVCMQLLPVTTFTDSSHLCVDVNSMVY